MASHWAKVGHMRRCITLLLLFILALSSARAAAPFTFEVGSEMGYTPEQGQYVVPLPSGYQAHIGDTLFYMAHLPDTTRAITITLDSRTPQLSGSGWCRGGATPLEQICDPSGPHVVWFLVKVAARG